MKYLKKVLVICVCLVAFLTQACATRPVVYSVAWLNERNLDSYEYTKYELIMVSGEKQEDEEGFDDTILSRGTLTLIGDKVGDNLYSLTQALEFTELATGKRTTMDSYAEFDGSLNPKKSTKTVDNDGEGYTIRVEYGDKLSIELVRDGQTESKELNKSVASGAFDNEMMYYIPRGADTLGLDFSATYEQFVGFDYFTQGVSPYTMNVASASVYSKVNLPANIYSTYFAPQSEDALVDAVKVGIAISGTRTDLPTYLYYAAQSFPITQISDARYAIKNVLLRAEIPNSNALGVFLSTTILRITEHSIIKP